MSSTGLALRTAAALAYSGWWLTGAILWFVERRDLYVRFHAAQAIVVFSTITAFVLLCGALAIASLSFVPSLFSVFVATGAAAAVGGVALWVVLMWTIARGDEWRIPVAAEWASRLCRVTPASAAASS